jgi:hypothetical protein
MGYADNINVMGRTKRAISEVYEELKESKRSRAEHQCRENKNSGRKQGNKKKKN